MSDASPQALADELSIECPICHAEIGAWCFKTGDVGLVHGPRTDAFEELAKEKVTNGEWSFIYACDHGSHNWCYPCMSTSWDATGEDKENCATCRGPLWHHPAFGTNFVGDGEGTFWHIQCAPRVVLVDVTGDHYP